MSVTIEVVRFTVPPERAGALVSGHEAARLAIDSVSPGWIWSRLARLDDRNWIEIVAWRDRASFDRALENSVGVPAAANWFELADPGWTIVLGEPVQGPDASPPAMGTLALTEAARGESSALVAAPDNGEDWSMLVDLGEQVWTEGEWRRSSPGLLRITVPDAARSQPPPSWTESAAIVHSCDASADAFRAA